MTLDPNVIYPSNRTFVLKLHRNAPSARGQLFGRLESLTSGDQFTFASNAELFTCLARMLPPAEAEHVDSGATVIADGHLPAR
jgi:hypothetical protein